MTDLSMIWTLSTTTWLIPAALIGLVWGILGGALPASRHRSPWRCVPFTYTMEPVVTIVMLASVYIGAEYGGSIPAILIRTPGTNSAAATVIDGYEMKRQGKAGEALGNLAVVRLPRLVVRLDNARHHDRAAVVAGAVI